MEEVDDDNRDIGNPNEEDDDDEDDDNEPMDDDDEEEAPGIIKDDTYEGGVAEGDESRTLASEADIVGLVLIRLDVLLIAVQKFSH